MKQRFIGIDVQVKRQSLWDERLAHKIAGFLIDSPLTPNMVTTISLVLVIISGLLFSTGITACYHVAALLFMLVRFLAHLDGELARAQQKESVVGYFYDWFTDTFSYSVLFISLTIGFQKNLNDMVVFLVILAVSACLINTVLKLHGELHENQELSKELPYFAGFSIDDGMYLIGPVCWLGYLFPFFITCVIGAIIYVVFVLGRFCLLLLRQSVISYNKTIDN